jgi:hypothetical protein
MNLRKIAVVGGFAVGAALTLAPLASADNTTDLTSAVSSEITSLNSMFTSDADLFGVGKDLIGPSAGQPFETISLVGAPDSAPFNSFDYFLYGLDPATNAKDDPGAYELFNGALSRFDDAYNIGLYALENNGALLPAADYATDLFGNTASLTTELSGLTATQAVTDLLGNGFTDLLGYF